MKDFYCDPLILGSEESDGPHTDRFSGRIILYYEKPLNEVLNPSFIASFLQSSPTWPNFATNLMRCFFTRETRIFSNVAGKCHKRKLDLDVMTTIKPHLIQTHVLLVKIRMYAERHP